MKYRLAISMCFLVNGFVFANWASRLPQIQENLSISNATLGWILLIHAIGSFIAMPITGWLIHKYSSRKVTQISALVFPVFVIWISISDSFLSASIPFFLMGAATGIMDVAMNAQAVEIEKFLKKPIMTNFHALFSVGMVLGALAGGFFTSYGSSLMHHFTIISLISIISIIAILNFFFPDSYSGVSDQPLIVLPKGPVVILGIIAFCCMMGEGAMSDWSTNYLKNIVGASEKVQTFGLTAFASTMMIGRFVGDRIRSSFGDGKTMRYGAISSLIGVVMILMVSNLPVVILGFGMVGLGLANIVPIVYSLSGSLPDINTGTGIAMATTIGYSGFMVGPPVIGFIADTSSLLYGMIFLGVLFFVMMMMVLFYSRKLNE